MRPSSDLASGTVVAAFPRPDSPGPDQQPPSGQSSGTLPGFATGIAAALAPIMSAISICRTKRNALRDNSYYFLHALNQQLQNEATEYLH
jgi:hypothetical protein